MHALDFKGSLEKLLVSYIGDSDLSVEHAAALCNTSKRTLQRKLKEMGTQYKTIIDHARFHVASQMLRNTNAKVYEIASFLGYSDSTNFPRAFRRIAGVSPRAYRQQYTQ